MTTVYTTVNGQILHEVRDGVEAYYRPDTLGNVIATTSTTGTVRSTHTYWPYGEVRASTGTNHSPFKYVGTLGYYSDSATTLYVRARYYRPAQTRWMTVDPLWPDECSYSYATSSPTSSVDPLGEAPVGVPIPMPMPVPVPIPALVPVAGILLALLALLAVGIAAWLCLCLLLVGLQHPVCDAPGGNCRNPWSMTCRQAIANLLRALACLLIRLLVSHICPQFTPGNFDHPAAIRETIRRLLRCAVAVGVKCGWRWIRDNLRRWWSRLRRWLLA
jgi:RHS repeat-associated protein